MIQLDGLRAWAILAVLVAHSFPPTFFLKRISIGFMGVRLFYVLSGFLITGILLRARTAIEGGRTSRRHVVKAFYIRRALRILPVYYVVLIAFSLSGVVVLRETLLWHALFGSNILFAWHGEWVEPIAQFWTLAVEEQFYLIWPAVILCVPQRHLGVFLAACVLTSPAFRFVLAHVSHNAVTARVLTPACIDSLAMGGIMALASWYHVPSLARTSVLLILTGVLVSAGTLCLRLVDFGWSLQVALLDLPVAAAFAGLVTLCSQRIRGAVATFLLEQPAMLYLGKISYGVYLFHNFVPHLLSRYHFGLLPPPGLFRFVLVLLVSSAMASLSWYLLENRVSRLKRHFPYDSGIRSESG